MNNEVNVRIFTDEIKINQPNRNFEKIRIKVEFFDDIWSVDLADMSNYETSNRKGFRYIFIITDYLSKLTWGIILKKKHGQT